MSPHDNDVNDTTTALGEFAAAMIDMRSEIPEAVAASVEPHLIRLARSVDRLTAAVERLVA